MKVIRLIQILLLLVLVCSCSKEQTVLSGYRDLKKELNKLRGQCSAYFIKSLPKQAKCQMEDAIEQISDIADGFMEAIAEEGVEELLDTEDR